MTRWVGLVVVVLAVVGCATTWEPVAARGARQAFENCRQETNAPDARLLWLAPDGTFRIGADSPEALGRMQRCLSVTAGVIWNK